MPGQLVLSWNTMVDQMNGLTHLWGIGKEELINYRFFSWGLNLVPYGGYDIMELIRNLKCHPCVYLCGNRS